RPGDVQRMSAGTGVTHSEFNPSSDDLVHFLQIWIIPDRTGLPPSYEQKTFKPASLRGKLRLVASPDGRDGSVTIHQKAEVYAALLARGQEAKHAMKPGRSAWLQVARGAVSVDGELLKAGDGASVTHDASVTMRADDDSELLLFDLS